MTETQFALLCHWVDAVATARVTAQRSDEAYADRLQKQLHDELVAAAVPQPNTGGE